MDKLALDCSKCGGALEITPEMDMFKCPFCGVPYMVERKDGTTRVIRLEQRVSVLEEKQVVTDEAVSAIGARQQVLDVDMARMELAKLRQERSDYITHWQKENPGLIGAAIGAAALTFGAVFCVSAFSIVEFNDITGPIAFFVCPGIVGLLAGVGWVSRYMGHRKRLETFDQREKAINQRIYPGGSDDQLRELGRLLRERRGEPPAE